MSRSIEAKIAERLGRAHGKGYDADQHADACRAKAPMIAVPFTEQPGNCLPKDRTAIDSHVENRKARVAARSAFGVQITHDGRNIGLQQPGPEDNKNKAQKERDSATRKGRAPDR